MRLLLFCFGSLLVGVHAADTGGHRRVTRSRLLDPLDLGLSSFVERATGDGNATKNEEPIYEKVLEDLKDSDKDAGKDKDKEKDEDGHGGGHGHGHGDGHGHGHGYVDRNVGSQQFIAGFSIVFFASVLMPFVYMVFSSDSDIIYYGWRVVYTTLAIFVALWTFLSIHAVEHAYLPHQYAFLVPYVYYAILQVVFMRSTTVYSLKVYSTIMGHMTGFAFEHAFADMGHAAGKEGKVWVPLLNSLLIFLIFTSLGYYAARLRQPGGLFERQREEPSLESERLNDHDHEHDCQHAEDDAVGIAVGFLWMQVLRWFVTNDFPDSLGDDEEHAGHSVDPRSMAMRIALLAASALVMAAMVVLGQQAHARKIAHADHAELSEPARWITLRLISQITFTCIFLAAWLLIFAFQWQVQDMYTWEDSNTVIRIATAGSVTWFCILLVYGFDQFSDSLFAARNFGLAAGVSNVISALGMAIGLGWERAFHRARDDLMTRLGQYYAGQVESLFDNNDDVPFTKDVVHECNDKCQGVVLLLTVLSAISVYQAFVPALRWYICRSMEDARMNARESHGFKRRSDVDHGHGHGGHGGGHGGPRHSTAAAQTS
jgi:hypothetical protein